MHRAMHDPLTGLPNRALFLDRLSARALAPPGPEPVHRRDVPRPRPLQGGQRCARSRRRRRDPQGGRERLTAATRTSATVARSGGDEFTVLCEGLRSPRDAVAIATRLVQSLRDPVPLADGGFAPMSISVGVAVGNGPDDRPESLLRDADAAMYRAKERGRNRVEVFDAGMRAVALARLELEHALELTQSSAATSRSVPARVDLGPAPSSQRRPSPLAPTGPERGHAGRIHPDRGGDGSDHAARRLGDQRSVHEGCAVDRRLGGRTSIPGVGEHLRAAAAAACVPGPGARDHRADGLLPAAARTRGHRVGSDDGRRRGDRRGGCAPRARRERARSTTSAPAMRRCPISSDCQWTS